MVDVIVAEVCPTAGDPAICLEEMPRFWDQISRIVFPAHWQHICDDLYPDSVEECKQALAELLPIALPLLAAQPRDWMETFCQGWGCTPWDETTITPLQP